MYVRASSDEERTSAAECVGLLGGLELMYSGYHEVGFCVVLSASAGRHQPSPLHWPPTPHHQPAQVSPPRLSLHQTQPAAARRPPANLLSHTGSHCSYRTMIHTLFGTGLDPLLHALDLILTSILWSCAGVFSLQGSGVWV